MKYTLRKWIDGAWRDVVVTVSGKFRAPGGHGEPPRRRAHDAPKYVIPAKDAAGGYGVLSGPHLAAAEHCPVCGELYWTSFTADPKSGEITYTQRGCSDECRLVLLMRNDTGRRT